MNVLYWRGMRQRTKRFFFIAGAIALGASQLWPLAPVLAQTQFNYDYIMADRDLTDYESMSLAQIQAFLESKYSPLANYVEPITSLRAAQIIYSTAQDFQISPKFLLALMQKEQSLIEDGTPLPSQYDWATGYAVCDSCNITDPLIQKFKGFYNQVYNAAKRIRTVYLVELEQAGQTSSGFGPGLTKLVDGLAVTPANKATAVAYTYTPHLHGNQLLVEVWHRFFAMTYPDGTLLNVDGHRDVWLIADGTRRKFANQSVYLSRYSDFDRILSVSQTDLERYAVGREIKFANYSYLRTPRGTVYLLVDDELRGFASAEALRRVGVNPEEIIDVAPEDIASYVESQPITTESVYPLGALLQDKKTGGVFWVENGRKHPIWSREIMKVNFAGRGLTAVSWDKLAEFETSAPVLFREGELVKSIDEPAVYLISHQQRRPFLSAAAFLALGFNWDNVVVTTSAALSLHQLGDPIVAKF